MQNNVQAQIETLTSGHKLQASLVKCEFHVPEVEFLEYIISADGIAMAPRGKVILDWPDLASLKDIQCFLSFANFYRRFMRNFAKIV